jgi:hypothetical protein
MLRQVHLHLVRPNRSSQSRLRLDFHRLHLELSALTNSVQTLVQLFPLPNFIVHLSQQYPTIIQPAAIGLDLSAGFFQLK